MPTKKNLYEQVRHIESLQKAWAQIYENGVKSSSKDTRASVQEFKLNEYQSLKAIRLALHRNKFSFDGIKGIGAQKAKKKSAPRPLVLSPPPVRIVQRSILDVLQSKPQIKKFLDVATSFGAIEKKGVPTAIFAAVTAIKGGATHYVKSDIKSFFTRISRPKVMKTIAQEFPNEARFLNLLEKATNLEVENLTELEKKYGADFKQLFIFDNVGTPQGCCLSPLFGNILLYDFDTAMNDGDIKCLRYLDDFIIFGPSLRAVNAAFRRALDMLESLGLTAYDPGKDMGKASRGAVNNGFEFLGVEFQGKSIRPAPKAREKLLNGIDEIIKVSKQVDFSKITNGSLEDQSLIKTLYLLHNKIKGWGNQYYFCNDKSLWGSLDTEIDKRIGAYFDHYFAKIRKFDWIQRRRQLGMHLLIDSKSDPILWD